jgi:hypothetical protein
VVLVRPWFLPLCSRSIVVASGSELTRIWLNVSFVQYFLLLVMQGE